MITTDAQSKEIDCKPHHTMGSLWICNHKINSNCPYALSFGYVYYCNNRNLHKRNSDQR